MVSIFKTSKSQKSAMSGTGIVRPDLGFWLFFTNNGNFVMSLKVKFYV
jgi:hypothetical protein